MSESKNSSDANRISTPQQTETSPLKQIDKKQNFFSRILFWKSVNDNEEGSLRLIVINFLVFTVVVTVALLVQIYYQEVELHGSVTSDSYECSKIGIDILKQGGNAVDAAIASTMCLGVVNFHITGLGGGGHMMIYNHKHQEVLDIIDFRPGVPNSYDKKHVDTSDEGLTVGVPGQLMGLWSAHQKYGKLPWRDLVMPALNLAKYWYGFIVSQNVISASMHLNNKSKYNENLIQFFSKLKEGMNVTFPVLAATLELIASSGLYELYNGSLAMDIVYSVNQAKGKMTLNDISQYHISHSELLHTKFGNFDILAPGSSSGGVLLHNALDNIQFLDLNADDDLPSIILKVSDTLHEAYVSFLEKNNALPSKSEPAASQVSTIDNEELYVVVVSGLNTWLGSQLLTGAGYILNNAITNGGIDIDGKPLSFSTPVIALESGEICGKRLLLGSGDATIAAQVLTNTLILNNNITSSVESPRFFIDDIPRHIRVEDLHSPFYSPRVIKKLQKLIKIDRIPRPYKSINVIEKTGDRVITHSDSRGGGLPSELK